MINLPTKIKDPAHAVRVLEALVKHEEDRLKRFKDYYDAKAPMAGILIRALAEGAKAVLEKIERERCQPKVDGTFSDGVDWGLGVSAKLLAQAYAPRMKEAGMTVPE